VLRVGLTGGIGSGKSTVARGLVRRGATLIDADVVAREVVAPGGAAYAGLVERFGPGVLHADGTLDRPALASVVFTDPAALADLNRITHPAIAGVIVERLGRLDGTDGVVVVDQPLLTASSAAALGLAVVVVVDTPTDVAVGRLVDHRGFSEADARARVAAQMDRAERRAFADVVVDNTGAESDLEERLDEVWAGLVARAATAA
jgi:dephospho-CoA kinase